MFNFLLLPFQWLFILLSSIRKCLYKYRILKRHSYNVPVICFGNLSSGGTGKTPMVKYFAHILKNEGFNVAIILRGYRRKTRGIILCSREHEFFEIGDEAAEYVKTLPSNIPVIVSRNRHQGIQFILNNFPETNVILMDDGFQHVRVKASMYVLLTDFHEPYFKDYVLPVGTLREPKIARKRAHYIVVTKCPKVLSPILRDQMIKDLKPFPHQQIFFASYDNYELVPVFPENNPESNYTKPYAIFLITGIKNPSPLEEELRLRCTDLKTYIYPDHHVFKEKEINRILSDFDRYLVNNKIIVTTEKDLHRLLHKGSEKLKKYPIFVIKSCIKIHPINGDSLEQKILSHVKENQQNKKVP